MHENKNALQEEHEEHQGGDMSHEEEQEAKRYFGLASAAITAADDELDRNTNSITSTRATMEPRSIQPDTKYELFEATSSHQQHVADTASDVHFDEDEEALALALSLSLSLELDNHVDGHKEVVTSAVIDTPASAAIDTPASAAIDMSATVSVLDASSASVSPDSDIDIQVATLQTPTLLETSAVLDAVVLETNELIASIELALSSPTDMHHRDRERDRDPSSHE